MAAASPIEGKTVWFQKEVTLQQRSKGCHLLDEEILSKLPEISNLKVGTAHIFSEFPFQLLLYEISHLMKYHKL